MAHGLRRTAFDQSSYAYWTGKYGVVNFKDFGAVGDGVHDDTAAIQRAINTANKAGRTIFLPPGEYLTSSTLKITEDGTVFYGLGNNSINGPTVIRPVSMAFDVFEISVYYGCTMANFNIKVVNQAGEGGRAFFLNNTQNVTLRNIGASNLYNGVYVTGGAITFDNVNMGLADISDTERYGYYVTGISGNGNLTTGIDSGVTGAPSYPNAVNGWVLADGYNTLILKNCGASNCNIGLWSTSGGGSPPNYLQTYNFGVQLSNTGVQLDNGYFAFFDGLLIIQSSVNSFLVNSTYEGGPIQVQSANLMTTTGGMKILGGTSFYLANSALLGIGQNTTGTNAALELSGSISAVATGVQASQGSGANVGVIKLDANFSGKFSLGEFLLSNGYVGIEVESGCTGMFKISNGIINNMFAYSTSLASVPVGSQIMNVSGYNPLGEIAPPASPFVSGTVYQNTAPVPLTIYQPAYATTSGTAGSVAVALGSSSSPSTLFTQWVNGSTTSSLPEVIQLRVPPGWYYSFTTTGATLANAQIQGE